MSSPDDVTVIPQKKDAKEKDTDPWYVKVFDTVRAIFIGLFISIIIILIIMWFNGEFKDGIPEIGTYDSEDESEDDSGGVDSFRKGYDNYNSGKFGIDFMRGSGSLGSAIFASSLSSSNSESNNSTADTTYHDQGPGPGGGGAKAGGGTKGGSSIKAAGTKDGSSGGFF